MESKSECLEADRKLVYFELQSHLNLHFDVGLHFLVDKYLAMFYHWMEFAPFKNDFFLIVMSRLFRAIAGIGWISSS